MPSHKNIKKTRIAIFLFSIFLTIPIFCNAQTDSTYIRPLEQKMGIRAYMGQNILFLNYDDGKGNEREFMPNSPLQVGLGFSIYNTIIGFNIGHGIRFLDKETYGKTKAFDFQIHHYNRRFVVDIYIQRYKGFYEEVGKDVFLYPDMRINRYAVHGHYIFNHKKFSYKSIFGQTERQIRSAGSWLAGIESSRIKVRSDEPLTSKGYTRSNNYQIGINGGYAYIWALGRYWNIGIASTIGISFGDEPFDGAGSGLFVYPSVSPRFSFVYDRGTWGFTTTFEGSALFMPISKDESFNMLSGAIQLSLIKRWGKVK